MREILRRPGVPAAVIAALASFAVMVSVMNLSGYIVVGHHHEQADVFTVISLHIVGMYALVLVIGQLIDKLGRRPGQVAGLLMMAFSTLLLAWSGSVAWMSVSLFLLGLGWNISYVAAVTELADRALPAERGKLIGLTDQLSSFTGATLVLLGGVDIFGGRGTIPGVVLAFFTLAVLGNALRLTNVSSDIQSIVVGLLLIVSVVIPTLARRVKEAYDRAQGGRRVPTGSVGGPGEVVSP